MNIERLNDAVHQGKKMMLFAADFDPEREWFANYWFEQHGFWLAVEVYNFATRYPEMVPPGTDVADLLTGALIHDIGKLSPRYPSELWLYPNGLMTPKERKYHVPDGIEILDAYKVASGKEIPAVIYTFIRGHHEWPDGTGYSGLSGSQIGPIEKIAETLDTLVAMCSCRPYKSNVHSFLSAWQEMNEGRGKYSGEILDKLLLMHAGDPRISEPGLGWIVTNTVPIFSQMSHEMSLLK